MNKSLAWEQGVADHDVLLGNEGGTAHAHRAGDGQDQAGREVECPPAGQLRKLVEVDSACDDGLAHPEGLRSI